MYRKEVNARSPFRVLERSIHGGLGRGNIGLVLGRAGVGKVGFIIGVALDDLMRGKQVLHVATDAPAEKIRAYYDEIFRDLAETTDLADREIVRLEIESNRMINTFRSGFSLPKVRGALAYIKEHMDFRPSMIGITGYPLWDDITLEEMRALKDLAIENDCEMWLAAQTHREDETDGRGLPARVARFEDFISVIVRLQPQSDHVRLELVKDHENADLADLHIELDPSTLLLKWR